MVSPQKLNGIYKGTISRYAAVSLFDTLSVCLGLGVADLVMGLQQKGSGQQAGRHTVLTIVDTVERGEILVPEQAAPQRGQQTVEGARPTWSRYTAGLLPKDPSDQNAAPSILSPHYPC